MAVVDPVNVPVVRTNGLRRLYGRGDASVAALAGVDLTVEVGEFVAVMGPSGSGKSTLMQILGLLDRPTEGAYELRGRDTSRLSGAQAAGLRGQKIAFVFQAIHLLPTLDALANVELPMYYARLPKRERARRAREALAAVGVGEFERRLPSQLSGGQCQRVAIARALAPEPDLLLADEPTGALDRRSGIDVLAAFQELNDRLGLTIVLVTHDPFVAAHAKRIVEMEDGKIVADRTVEERTHAKTQGAHDE